MLKCTLTAENARAKHRRDQQLMISECRPQGPCAPHEPKLSLPMCATVPFAVSSVSGVVTDLSEYAHVLAASARAALCRLMNKPRYARHVLESASDG
mmetsp:Transcript_19683/g.61943  ORF Transcript_19683/g.61943 Transcript_19683/m.61943 type:complete len:97 (-) Transcript_19683:125-415(-)